MNYIEISALSNEEKSALVCLYYAQLKRSDDDYKPCHSNLRIIAEKYNYKYATIKNNKDAYDALYDNGRRGWLDRPLEKRSKFLYDIYLKYKDYSLDKPIKREDLVPYGDTYGIIGIAPIIKWEPNQAISQLSEKSAVALMRAMLELSPSIEEDLDSLVDTDVSQCGNGGEAVGYFNIK